MDEEIKSIDLVTSIRKRPGMYLGFPSVDRLFMFLQGYNLRCKTTTR